MVAFDAKGSPAREGEGPLTGEGSLDVLKGFSSQVLMRFFGGAYILLLLVILSSVPLGFSMKSILIPLWLVSIFFDVPLDLNGLADLLLLVESVFLVTLVDLRGVRGLAGILKLFALPFVVVIPPWLVLIFNEEPLVLREFRGLADLLKLPAISFVPAGLSLSLIVLPL
jgi:hypothetical protein